MGCPAASGVALIVMAVVPAPVVAALGETVGLLVSVGVGVGVVVVSVGVGVGVVVVSVGVGAALALGLAVVGLGLGAGVHATAGSTVVTPFFRDLAVTGSLGWTPMGSDQRPGLASADGAADAPLCWLPPPEV
jgi:hypothetical protein